jgi:hypothetical protein
MPAFALPLYASREGRTCVTCHVDPNGGGMRNEFGFNYGKNRHALEEEEKWSEVTVTPQVNEWIRLGLDTRFMYYTSHVVGTSGQNPSTFFPMEGNFRIAITPFENLSIVGTQGIAIESSGYPGNYIARELYALYHGLAHGGFVQVGKFRVPFGLRQDDHTSLTRYPLILPYNSQGEDAGVEVGAVGRNWFGQASITNGGDPFDRQAGTYVGKIGRASGSFQFGLSGYHTNISNVPDTNRWSLYVSTTRGRFTLLGEYVADNFKVTENREAAFTEVVYRAARGVNLRAKLDYLRRPESQSSFASIARRYLAEVDLDPMPFTEIKLSYRHYNYDYSADLDEYFGMLFVPF